MHVKPTQALSGIGIAALIAGGVAGASMLHSSAIAREVMLTGSLGDGVALILGPGGSPTVPDAYMNTVDQLYLEPLGFTGQTVAVDHDWAELFNSRIDIETAAIVDAVNAQMATGDVSPADPLVIMGYSESAAAATVAMQELNAQGNIPADDLHFVLLGDSASNSCQSRVQRGGIGIAAGMPPARTRAQAVRGAGRRWLRVGLSWPFRALARRGRW